MRTVDTNRLDWISVILLLLMIQTASARLVITDWTENLTFSQTLAMIGIVLGLALGYSQFKRTTVGWLTAGYSIVLIPWQLIQAIEGDVLLSERLISVGGRLLFSSGQFFRGEVVEDSLLFVAVISTLVWFLSMASGFWWTRHKNYLAAVLPGAFFTLVIHLYDWLPPARSWVLGVYILWALILLGRLHFMQNREHWQKKRVFQTQETEFDLTRGMIIATAIFVFVAWTIPASATGWQTARESWRRITKPWREVQEWLSNAVESLESPIAYGEGDLFNSQLSLGSGNPLGDTVIFTVKAPELPQKPPRFYWRGYTYAFYSNDNWRTASIKVEEFSPSEQEVLIPSPEGRIQARFIVSTKIKQFLVYTPAQATWVSRAGEIRFSPTDTDAIDLAAWYVDPGLLPGEQFQTEAALADPSTQILQAAGQVYPEWISERYLQLPDNFSPRIRALAGEITADLETPYEKTVAITKYLRDEIEYVNPLPESPPQDVDLLEWILFDVKKGFCNYYATAEVLMLRSIGIPARLAVGFAQGVFDSESNTYTIRNLDTHAWPEVYFPGVGWVEFEPTGNQEPLTRPDRPEDEPSSQENAPDLEAIDPEALELLREIDESGPQLPEDIILPGETPTSSYRFVYLSAAIFLLGLLWLINRRYAFIERIPIRLKNAYEGSDGQVPMWIVNWAHWTSLSPIERSFETINQSLRMLGSPPAVQATPSDRADALSEILPNAIGAINTLTTQHLASLFMPEPGDEAHAQRASIAIRLYTMQALIRRIIAAIEQRFSRPGQFR